MLYPQERGCTSAVTLLNKRLIRRHGVVLSMLLNHVILAILWTVYCVLHSVLADTEVKRKLRARLKNEKWYRIWYTLFAFFFLVALLYFQVTIATVQLFPLTGVVLIAGLLLSFSGLSLMVVCIGKYFMSLSGLRSIFMESYSNELQIKGVHQYIRHPLYLGTFVFIWGLFLLLPYLSLLIANVIITAYTLIGIGFEEKKLVREFGSAYEDYRRSVPKLIPFLRPKQRG